MRIQLAAASAALCLSLLAPTSASAEQALTSKIVQPPGVPVRLDSCVSQNSGVNYTVLEFQNTAQQPIDAIEVKIDVFDAFGASLGSLSVQKSGTFAPGVDIRAKRLFGIVVDNDIVCLDYIPNAASASCAVDRVKYSDGSVWTAPDSST